MQNKKNDVEYCGVRKEYIQNAKPVLNKEVLSIVNHWCFERYRIKLRKNAGESTPWTEDEILRDYRFTNLRRVDDKESVHVIRNICERTDLSLESKIYNIIFARMYNKWETMEKLGGPRDWSTYANVEEYRKIFEREMENDPKYVWFTSAYNMGGMKKSSGSEYILYKDGVDLSTVDLDFVEVVFDVESVSRGDKDVVAVPRHISELCQKRGLPYNVHFLENDCIPLRIVKRINQLKRQNLFGQISNCSNQQEVFSVLNSIKGYGDFLSYQLFVDFTYIPEFPFSNNEFAMCGPGTTRGLALLFEDKDGMTDPECVFWMRDNLVEQWKEAGLEYDLKSLMVDLPEEERKICVSDYTNVMCELTKYYRTLKGIGRPKVRYTPQFSGLEEFMV